MKEEILKLIIELNEKIEHEQDFREKEIPKPHPTDAIRSIEREYIMRDVVKKLKKIVEIDEEK